MALTINDVLTYGLRGTARKIRTGVPRTKFLQEHFFGGEGGIVTAERTLKLKVKKLSRKASDFAQWDTKGNILSDKDGYAYVLIDAPYLYDRRIITPSDLAHLDFEEDPRNPMPYDEKLMLCLRNCREDLYDEQDTRVELMAMEMLQSGSITTPDLGTQTYPISATMFVDADSDADGNLDNATNPVDWIEKKLKKIYDDSGILANEIVLSPELIWTLLGSSVVNDVLLDTRRINGGQMDFEEYRDDGVAFFGYLNIPEFGAVALLTYAGRYTDANGIEQSIFPANSMLIGRRNLGNINYAGVYSNAEGYKMSVPVAQKEFVHVVEGDGDIPANLAICRQTSPVLAPMVMGGWMFVENVNQ